MLQITTDFVYYNSAVTHRIGECLSFILFFYFKPRERKREKKI